MIAWVQDLANIAYDGILSPNKDYSIRNLKWGKVLEQLILLAVPELIPQIFHCGVPTKHFSTGKYLDQKPVEGCLI